MPAWPCPTCGLGTLQFEVETEPSKGGTKQAEVTPVLCRRSTGETRRDWNHEAWEPDWIRGVFVALLRCNRSECAEAISVSGSYRMTGVERPVSADDQWEEEYTPLHFHPAPPLLRLPAKCPEAVSAALQRAWAAYWGDPGACANHLRTSIERLMDHIGIPAMKTLDHRIQAYEKLEPERAQELMAIKWLGNSGSHGDEGLTQEDILDALEVLEHTLAEILVSRTKERQAALQRLRAKHDPNHGKPPQTATKKKEKAALVPDSTEKKPSGSS